VSKTRRPLGTRIQEHERNLSDALMNKSKLTQHIYEGGHRIGWEEVEILQI
jgi:hypothetical protein